MKKTARSLPEPPERVRLGNPIGRRTLRLLAGLLLIALFVASFAVGTLFQKKTDQPAVPPGASEEHSGLSGDSGEAALRVSESANAGDSDSGQEPASESSAGSAIPENAVLIRTVTLPDDGLNNRTQLQPDAEEVDWWLPATEGSPAVLIVVPLPWEAYCAGETCWFAGAPGDETWSDDPERSVERVAGVLRRSLAENGVPVICVAVTGGSGSVAGGYARSAEIVSDLLRQYPDVRYVIDLHRDDLFDEEGNYIRPVADASGGQAAQITAVVGVGTDLFPCPLWRENLAFARSFGETVNQNCDGLFCGISLVASTYHQDLTQRSILLKIGTGANTVEEASRSARIAGEALAQLLQAPAG